MKPRLLFSELTGTVYVVTRYSTKPHPSKPGSEIILASKKYDVTEDFDAATGPRRSHLRRLARKRKKS